MPFQIGEISPLAAFTSVWTLWRSFLH